MGCSMSAKEQVMQPSANIKQDGTVEKKPDAKADESNETKQTSPNKAEPIIHIAEENEPQPKAASGGGNGGDDIDKNDGVTTDVATEMDLDVFRWQNVMRTNPTAFIPDLEAMLPKFEGNLYDNCLSTHEGAAVVQELIDYLKTVEPTHALEWVDDIAKASKDHVLDCAPTGATGHDGVDGSTFGERMDRYTKREGSSGENISYGQNTAKKVLIQLAVDDNVESRGHRLNIMNGAYVKTGCYSGEHSKYTHSTVLNYNGDPRRIGKGGAIFDFGAFMAEEVVWEDEPEGHQGYSESCAGGVGNQKATKTVKRTYNMPDGSKIEKEQVIEKDI